MRPHDRVPQIEALGFTPRQSCFLALATRSGGFFLRRQYAEWAGISARAHAVLGFTGKLVRRGFVRPFRLRGPGYLYQVAARSLYHAVGDFRRDNQVQRLSLVTMVERVRLLDFVVAHKECEVYSTVRDKAQLARDYDVRLEMLASPVFRRPGSPAVWVAYIWAERTVTGFGTFMRRALPLLEALPQAGVTLVIPRHAVAAASACARLFHQLVREGVLRYFSDRCAWDRGDYAAFPPARVWQLRQDETRYGGEKYQALYRRWQLEGDAALGTLPVFEVYELPHSYQQFGPWATY